MMNPRVDVLIPAAGTGSRMDLGKNKVFALLGGMSIIEMSVALFHQHKFIHRIWVSAKESDFDALNSIFSNRNKWNKLMPWVAGGKERQDSVANGLKSMREDPPDWVLVHDGARPLLSIGLLDRLLQSLQNYPAVVPVLPIHDTVRILEEGETRVVDRSNLFRTQTPQGFYWKMLVDAHHNGELKGIHSTDDAQLVEAAENKLEMIKGEARNLKITEPEDFTLAMWLIEHPNWGK